MDSKKQETETTSVYSTPYRVTYIKCLLENGHIERHSFKGNIEDIVIFMEKLAGKVIEIQFMSQGAMEYRDEEKAYAMPVATEAPHRR